MLDLGMVNSTSIIMFSMLLRCILFWLYPIFIHVLGCVSYECVTPHLDVSNRFRDVTISPTIKSYSEHGHKGSER